MGLIRKTALTTVLAGAGLAGYLSAGRPELTATVYGAALAEQGASTPSLTDPENRRVFYGDLHLHTTYSGDAWSWGTKVTPAMAFAFAKGEPVKVPAIQLRAEQGLNVKDDVTVRRAWPLDFFAVTDHADAAAL